MDSSEIGRYGTLRLVKRLSPQTIVASFPIDEEELTFGRDPKCSVRLYYPSVSAVHARIIFQDRKVRVIAVMLASNIHIGVVALGIHSGAGCERPQHRRLPGVPIHSTHRLLSTHRLPFPTPIPVPAKNYTPPQQHRDRNPQKAIHIHLPAQRPAHPRTEHLYPRPPRLRFRGRDSTANQDAEAVDDPERGGVQPASERGPGC